MKKFMICILAIAAITACKKSSMTTTTSNGLFSGCFNTYYYNTNNSGITDTNHITYISDDSLSYTSGSGVDAFIYCYKHSGDSVIVRRYTGDLSNLTLYGTFFLNNRNLASSDFLYHQDGSLNDSSFNNYDANSRLSSGISNYGTYRDAYAYHYDANGNKTYSIFAVTGSINYRDSFVYTYDLSKTDKMINGYPLGFLYGKPDNNILTQSIQYDADADTVQVTTTYTYTFDGNGYITQQNTHSVYAGSGLISNRTEKYTTDCR